MTVLLPTKTISRLSHPENCITKREKIQFFTQIGQATFLEPENAEGVETG